MASKLIFLALVVLLFSSLVLAEKKLAKKDDKHAYNKPEIKEHNNHHEEPEHEEHKDEYKNHEEEPEKKGYKGGKKYRLKSKVVSAKWYKFCTFVKEDTNCTERASCAILENAACHTLLDGNSVYLSVVGKSYVLLRFTDTKCTTADTQTLSLTYNYDLKDSTLEECQAVKAPVELNYVVSPLRRRDYN